MEEDIKNLTEIIELCKEEINNNDESIHATLDLIDLKSLKNLLKGYRELYKKHDDLLVDVYDLFVPKSKIKEKIEKLEQEKDKTYTQFLGSNRIDEKLSTKGKMLEGAIQVLQELMEDK